MLSSHKDSLVNFHRILNQLNSQYNCNVATDVTLTHLRYSDHDISAKHPKDIVHKKSRLITVEEVE